METLLKWIQFIIGLIGVLIHTFVVLFILSYVLYPDALEVMIEVTSGNEQQLLLEFQNEVLNLGYMVYPGSIIIIFEWLAIFKTKKFSNEFTPIWGSFLILGSLYSYFYFGGLVAAILLFISSVMSIIKYVRTKNS